MKKQLKKLVAVGLSVMTLVSSMSLQVFAGDSEVNYLYEDAGIVLDETTPYTMGDGVEGYLSTDGKTLVVKGSGALTDASTVPTGIKTIYIESGITSIDTTFNAQYQTLENVYMAEGLESINPNYTMSGFISGCQFVKEIVLPDSVKTINYNAFSNCSGLTSITLGKNLESIGPTAWSGNDNLKYININTKTVTRDIMIVLSSANTESLVINFGDSVEVIESFKTSANFYKGLRTTPTIESITIPNSVTYIEDGAFAVDSSSPQTVTVYTSNKVAKDYDWASDYITATIISTSDMQNMAVTMTINADVTTTDVTIPIEGLQIGIDSNGDISSPGMVIESNTSFPVKISVDSVEVLGAGDTTNSLSATNVIAPTLVAADKYTVDEWNAMNPVDTRKEIAIAIKQVDMNDDGTAGTELTEATTDSLKVTTPVELGNLSENTVLAHLESGYGTASTCGVNIVTDTAYTNYGKAWSGDEDIVFRYIVTLEISADN